MLYPIQYVLYPSKMYVIPNKMYVIPNRMYVIPNKMHVIPNRMYVIPNKMHALPNRMYVIPNDKGYASRVKKIILGISVSFLLIILMSKLGCCYIIYVVLQQTPLQQLAIVRNIMHTDGLKVIYTLLATNCCILLVMLFIRWYTSIFIYFKYGITRFECSVVRNLIDINNSLNTVMVM